MRKTNWEVRGRIGRRVYKEWWNPKTLAMMRVMKTDYGYFIDANKLIPYINEYGGVGGFTVPTQKVAMRIVNKYLQEYEK